MIPVWCLMPKGEKLRPKQEMDQLPLENFENSRVRVFVCQNTLIVSNCQKLVSCGENV
jgi:intracellular sulfur oxidation DsrE/DsrF family protein